MDMGIYTPDNLIAGSFPVKTGEGTILAGEGLLRRGAVLGKVTATGMLRLCNSANNDGSQTPKCILVKDILAGASNVSHVPIYLSGDFESTLLSFGGTNTVDTHRDAMRDLNMYIQTGSDQFATMRPRVAPPSFNLADGTYNEAKTLTIVSFSGATTYYRINGGSYTEYTTPITIDETSIIDTYSEMGGYSDSIVKTVSLTIIPTLSTPTFNPVAGTYTGTQSVAITFDENATTCQYSLDNENWTTYTTAVSVTATGILYAKCSAVGYNDSSASANYTIGE